VGPLRSGEISRPDSRDPVASGVKCGPHGGVKTRKPSGYLVEPHNQHRRLGGQRQNPGAPRSFNAGGHVAGSQGLRREDAVCGNGVTVR
jgi:hypothetical protein